MIEKVPVSEICDEYKIAVSVFYKWQAQLFEQGEKVFSQTNREAPQTIDFRTKNSGIRRKVNAQGRGTLRIDGKTHKVKKKSWPVLNGKWVEFDVRDEVIDFINKWSSKTEINIMKIIDLIGISRAKHYDWKARYGLANEHNAKIQRDHWLEEEEKKAIVKYYQENKTEGYKRLTYMLIDANIVAVSPSSVYRVLKNAGLMRKWSKSPSKKGTGFEQPIVAHQHWHIDISYINIGGTFFYLCVILDGFSRYIINWDIGEQMTERDVEVILEQSREKFLLAKPRIISDNGPQFIARDFKEYIRICGMTHVKILPYYSQSNSKLERVK